MARASLPQSLAGQRRVGTSAAVHECKRLSECQTCFHGPVSLVCCPKCCTKTCAIGIPFGLRSPLGSIPVVVSHLLEGARRKQRSHQSGHQQYCAPGTVTASAVCPVARALFRMAYSSTTALAAAACPEDCHQWEPLSGRTEMADHDAGLNPSVPSPR